MTCLFSILGETRLRIGFRLDKSWATPKARGMLGVLLTSPGSWFTTSELVEWMWAEDDKLPRNLAQTFYNYSGRIRHALELMNAGVELDNRKGGYRLTAVRTNVDYFLSTRLLDRSRDVPEPRDALRVIRQAMEYWAGDSPLADLPGEPARAWRRQAHENTWLPMQNALCVKLLADNDFRGVIGHIDGLPVADSAYLPLVMRRLEAMRGLYLRSEMDAYYYAMRRRLQDEFEDAAAATLKKFYEGLAEPARVETRASGRSAAAPRRLPHDVEGFVGRDALLAKIDAVTGCARGEPRPGVVLLHGAAGVGKTALALHWAHRVADSFPDGALHCDLKGFAADRALDASVVVDRFLEALGIDVDHLTTTERRARLLESTLQDRRALVVLDNVRGLPQVAPLLPLLRDCTVLVTSRNRLPGLGPRAFPVEPLGPSEAARMLEARIGDRAVRDRYAVEDLGVLCGGLPLAMEIVAHRIAASPGAALAEFVARLGDERRLLNLGNHGAGGDISLKTVFSWSYRMLSTQDRRAFRLLGLHPGPDLSIDAVAAILGTTKSIALDCLELLASAHLLEQPGSLYRYRFHDLLRDYAEECARADEAEQERDLAEHRLVDFFLHTAKAADSVAFPYRGGVAVGDPVAGVLPLDFDHDRGAQDWFIEERANLCAVIDLASRRGMHSRVCRMAHVLSDMFRRCGYYEEARAVLTLAVGSAQLEDDGDAEAAAYNDLGLVYFQQSAFLEARKHFHRAHLMARSIGSGHGIAVSLHLLARVDVAEGRIDDGVVRYQEVLSIVGEVAYGDLEAGTLHRLGVVAMDRNNRVDAAKLFHRALDLRERLGNLAGQADTLGELAELHRRQGELRTAEDYVNRAISLHMRTRDQAVAAHACEVLATIRRDGGDLLGATYGARRAVELYDRVGNSRSKAEALVLLGELRWAAKARAAALEGWAQAFKIFADAGDPRAAAVAARLDPFDGERTVPASRSPHQPSGSTDGHPEMEREAR
ncbi:tetratricopeptide repeat protein [Saccharothrix sp. HUAS TT1]|uniref:AfsR/SARP family transcriptional regulator n=1 Tax=unclassified Saccharothrix TaxID=2593673 RepID=UPI00345BFB6F